MQKKETGPNTEAKSLKQLTFNLGPENEEPPPKKFRSKYTALMSLLEAPIELAVYKKEVGIIKRILSCGYTELQIYGAWIFYKEKGQRFKSFAILLWEKCKLMKEVVPLLNLKSIEPTKLSNKDFRTSKDYVEPPKSKKDFLK